MSHTSECPFATWVRCEVQTNDFLNHTSTARLTITISYYKEWVKKWQKLYTSEMTWGYNHESQLKRGYNLLIAGKTCAMELWDHSPTGLGLVIESFLPGGAFQLCFLISLYRHIRNIHKFSHLGNSDHKWTSEVWATCTTTSVQRTSCLEHSPWISCKLEFFFVSLEPSLCDAKRDQGIPPASFLSESSTSTRDLERDVMGKKEMDITSRNVPHPKRQVWVA